MKPDRDHTPRLLRMLAVLVALALVAAACGGSDDNGDDTAADTAESVAEPTAEVADEPEPTPEPDPTSEPEPTATTEPTATPEPEPTEEPAHEEVDETLVPLAAETIAWETCGDRLQCGTVEVPIDYDDPSAGTIDIAVNVRRSADLDARVGYLLFNPGGPGASGVDTVANAELFAPDELLAAFDLVGFDPRGVGQSGPDFACGASMEQFDLLKQIDGIPETDEEVEIGNQAAALCVDSMGAAAVQLGTDEVARDMDEIRKGLGADQISFLGLSYGSVIGGWYASLFPDNVRSMVLDGAGNPLLETETIEEVLEAIQVSTGPIHEQLAQAIDSCDESCPIWNDGDPRAYWYEAVNKFDIVQEAANDDVTQVGLGVVGHLYGEDGWVELHESLRALQEDDDPSGFLAAAARASLGLESGEVSFTGYVNCLDQWALFPDDDLASQVARGLEYEEATDAFVAENYPLLDAIDLEDQASVCPFLGSLNPPPIDATFDGGGVPILVVGNTSDPVTPFVQSEQYANDVLSNGRLVTTSAPQHVVYPTNACVNDLVHDALIEGIYPDATVECERESDPGIDEIVMVESELPDGAIALVPESWIDIAPGVTAPNGDPNDPVLLAYQPSGGSVEADIATVEGFAPGATAELAGDVEVNGVTWSLFEMVVDEADLVVRFALSQREEGGNMIILGQAFSDEIQQLSDNVLTPALQGFQFPN